FDDGANLALQWFGVTPRMLLMGSVSALVLAYVLRFAIIAAGGAEAGLARIPPSLDQAARGLGDSPGTMLWRVHLPLLRPALAAAALLVFVDAMKELPATLLLRPLNFETLATWLDADAARGAYEAGAVRGRRVRGWWWTGCRWRWPTARSAACSVPRAAARPRCCARSPGSSRCRPAASCSTAGRCPAPGGRCRRSCAGSG